MTGSMSWPGANSGLGAAAAVSLLGRCHVDGRDPNRKYRCNASTLHSHSRPPGRFVELADLSLLSDVNELSDRLLAEDRPIDVLINNAGALFNDFAVLQKALSKALRCYCCCPGE